LADLSLEHLRSRARDSERIAYLARQPTGEPPKRCEPLSTPHLFLERPKLRQIIENQHGTNRLVHPRRADHRNCLASQAAHDEPATFRNAIEQRACGLTTYDQPFVKRGLRPTGHIDQALFLPFAAAAMRMVRRMPLAIRASATGTPNTALVMTGRLGTRDRIAGDQPSGGTSRPAVQTAARARSCLF
jgi:hypothetical protein